MTFIKNKKYRVKNFTLWGIIEERLHINLPMFCSISRLPILYPVSWKLTYPFEDKVKINENNYILWIVSVYLLKDWTKTIKYKYSIDQSSRTSAGRRHGCCAPLLRCLWAKFCAQRHDKIVFLFTFYGNWMSSSTIYAISLTWLHDITIYYILECFCLIISTK